MSARVTVDGPAVVTGALRGIGRAVAEAFAASFLTGQTLTPRGVPPIEETPQL